MVWHAEAKKELERQRDELLEQVRHDSWTDENGTVHEKGLLLKELEDEEARETALYPQEQIYHWVIIFYAIVHILLLGGFFLGKWWLLTTSPDGGGVNLGVLILGFQVLHLAFSLRSVSVDNLAGIDFFGRPAKLVDPGLILVPRGLLRLTIISRNYEDKRFPGPPEKIHRVSAEVAATSPEGDAPPEGSGKVRPIFITTGKAVYSQDELDNLERGEDADPLDVQMNIDVSAFIRFRPNTEYGGIFRIMRNLSRKDFLGRAIDLLREQMDTNLTEIFSTQTVSTIIANRELVNEVLWLKTIFTTLRFGIQVDQARTLELNPSHKTNEAQAEAVRERFERSKTIVRADAEMQRLTREGRGAAEAERLRLMALAKGYKAISNRTGASGEAIIASETAKEVLSKNADTIVLGASGATSDLLSLVPVAEKLLKRRKPDEQSPETPEGEA